MRRTTPVGPPAPDAPLASLADLKADLGISDASQDARLALLLQDASSMALVYVGRPLIDRAWCDVIELGCEARQSDFVLGRYPVSAVTGLTIGATALDVDTVAALAINPEAGILYPPDDGSARCWMAARYVVTYRAGYTLDSVTADGTTVVRGTLPASIQRAVRLTAAALWHATGRDPLLKSESEQGVGSTSWDTSAAATGGMPQAAADILDAYRPAGVA
ncbi:phage head-tail connector protein [Acetobacter sacchari]|uniref:Phage head-tail connector protein n=2 Tax=Acetobacter TaxID=434 RepID=A0ABS3M050_9PROT|nr:phage head-tail connector protein [Acetobacter sacchari]MBO1361529.1 phage head-tail connector protein [Acetobacter sacchari]